MIILNFFSIEVHVAVIVRHVDVKTKTAVVAVKVFLIPVTVVIQVWMVVSTQSVQKRYIMSSCLTLSSPFFWFLTSSFK